MSELRVLAVATFQDALLNNATKIYQRYTKITKPTGNGFQVPGGVQVENIQGHCLTFGLDNMSLPDLSQRCRVCGAKV